MPQDLSEWWATMPTITKAYFVAALGSTVFVMAGTISPMHLYLDFDMVVSKLEIWRLVTCFCFFGKFSMSFLFQMMMLTQYCRGLEDITFPGAAGRAEMSFMLFCGALMMWTIAFFLELPFLSSMMIMFIMYVWSRKNPQQAVSLWGFGLKGWQMPFAMTVLGVLLGGSPTLDILGILCGHTFHFFADIFPLRYGRQVLVCPQFVYNLFDGTAQPARAPAFTGQGHRLS